MPVREALAIARLGDFGLPPPRQACCLFGDKEGSFYLTNCCPVARSLHLRGNAVHLFRGNNQNSIWPVKIVNLRHERERKECVYETR